MAFNFGRYSYIGPIDAGKTAKDYEFNDEKKKEIQQMLNEKRYIDAANELAKYTFKDTKEEEAYWNNVQNLYDQGSIAEAVYTRINNLEDKEKLMFSSNVFAPGGLDDFNRVDNDGKVINENKYAKHFGLAKKALGTYPSTGDFDTSIASDRVNGSSFAEATKLEFTFQQAQQKLLGFDALAKDNNMTLDNFYKVSGLSEEDLAKAGIFPKHNNDGSSTIIFDKSNPLANQLIVSLSKLHDFNKSLVGEIGDIFFAGGSQHVKIKGYDRHGHSTNWTTDERDGAIRDMAWLVEHTKEASDRLFAQQNVGETVHNSMAAAFVPSEDEEKLIDSELNLAYSIDRYPEVYSDYYDDNTGKMRPLDQEEREQIIRELTGADPKRRKYSYVIEGGQIGLMIELAPIATPDKERKEGDSDKLGDNVTTSGRQRRVFIPGMFAEQAQEAVNNDPLVKAKQIVNNMQSFGAVFHTVDNKDIKLYPSGEGLLTIKTRNQDGSITEKQEWLSADEVTKEVAKSKTVEMATRHLLSEYTNIDGKLIDGKELELQMKSVAVSQMNEFYGRPLVDEDGNRIDPTNPEVYIKTVFDILNSPSRLAKYRENRSELDYKRLMDIFEVYKNLQLNVRKYRQ